MRILAIGDFHGKFPEKLKREVKKADLILCTGDYAGIEDFRPLLHKVFRIRAKGRDIQIVDLMGEQEYNKLLKKDYGAGKKIIIELNKLNKKIYSVFGNNDWYKAFFNTDGGYYEKIMKRQENFKNINRGKIEFKNMKIVGFGGYIDNDVYFTKKGKYSINDNDAGVKRRKKRYLEEKKKFIKLMKNKPDILLLHYNPYNCLDKMKTRGFPLSGSHMGISFFNKGIKKYSPFLAICGHMHENQGKCKIGKTIVVNPGAALEGKAAIIEIDETNKKVLSVKFIS